MRVRKKGVSQAALPADHDLSILGHELGNVLNGLLGMTELLLNSGVEPEQKQWLRSIECCGRQLQQIVEWIESSAGGREPEFRPRRTRFDGPALLEQALTSHLPAALKRRDELVLLLDPEVPRFWFCDPCLLRQLVDNLLSNALKHTVSGEVSLHASTVTVDGAEGSLLLRVVDSGTGIDSGELKEIFDAYRQGHGSVEGRGLGLYICKRIVRALGGQIGCSNSGGRGACFEIILPDCLLDRDEDFVPGADLLSRIHCSLHLTGSLYRSVVGIFTRLGVSCGPEGPDQREQPDQVLLVAVHAETAADHLQMEALPVLRLESRSLASRRIPLPAFESTLGPALLEMALERLSQRDRPG